MIDSVLLPAAKPILKWAGGKTQLLPEILSRAPKSFETYHEPFVGGGAVFFALAPSKSILADGNRHLIEMYLNVRDSTEELSDELRGLETVFNELPKSEQAEFYTQRRKEFNEGPGPTLRRSALMIFLNKAGFNGMYRENARGEFNIPFGKKTKLNLPTYEHLSSCAVALMNSDIISTGFETVLDRAEKRDFVYFDPPYFPVSKSASFTAYQANGFGQELQERLAKVARELTERGVFVLLSNSDVPVARELYQDFNVERVSARRNINSKGSARGPVSELLVSNY